MTRNVPRGEYHYDLYLPPGYEQNKTEVYPCLFIADPAGNAHLGNMADRVKRDEMIAVMLVESKNGDWEPIFANFCAAHDDAVKRVRIGLKWMTGLSAARGPRASAPPSAPDSPASCSKARAPWHPGPP